MRLTWEAKDVGKNVCRRFVCFSAHGRERVRAFVGVHVDDMIIVMSSNQGWLSLEENLSSSVFLVRHLGVLTWYYMGGSSHCDARGGTLEIPQNTLGHSLIERFGLVKKDPIPASTLVDTDTGWQTTGHRA